MLAPEAALTSQVHLAVLWWAWAAAWQHGQSGVAAAAFDGLKGVCAEVYAWCDGAELLCVDVAVLVGL